MKYQIRNAQLSLNEGLNMVDEFSFVRNQSNKSRDLTPKLQNRRQSQQLLCDNRNESCESIVRTSIGGLRSRENLCQSVKPSGQSPKTHLQGESTHDHSLLHQSGTRSSQSQRQIIRYQPSQDNNEQIYYQMMNVLQLENRNLKDQNQYLIKQYKKISKENYVMKQQIEQLGHVDQMHVELQKLRNINKAYQTQIQQLKEILLGEIAAIHHKFNLFVSDQDATFMRNQLNCSIKKSSTLMKTDHVQINEKNTNPKMTSPAITPFSEILGQMLQIGDENDDGEKSSGKTLQSMDKENLLNLSNDDQKNQESPTETTFSGYLRSSN